MSICLSPPREVARSNENRPNWFRIIILVEYFSQRIIITVTIPRYLFIKLKQIMMPASTMEHTTVQPRHGEGESAAVGAIEIEQSNGHSQAQVP
jgi:hypothetical protein